MTDPSPGRFAVHVDRSSLTRSRSGRIGGNIWLRVGGRAFPEPSWEDAVVVVLGWWAQDVERLSSESVAVVLEFVEGPFRVRLAPLRDGRVLAVAHQEMATGVQVLAEGHAVLNEVQRSVCDAALTVVTHCREHGWTSPDVSVLETAMDSLKRRLS